MSSTYGTPRLYGEKLISAEDAARLVKPGQHVFIGTACATPRTLVAALEALPKPPPDVELLHFITTGAVRLSSDGRVDTRYRHRCFFVGVDLRPAVAQGVAEYVPISIGRVPELFRNGRIPVDVAFIQVSSPDRFGYVSLGVSVDVVAAAIDSAELVVAEVNPAMPWTMGDSTVHLSKIDHLVEIDAGVYEYLHTPVEEEVVERIARYIAGIIDDGSTLQIGIGRIPSEALKYLVDRRDLGVHSEVITDAIIPLLEKGILTGARKTRKKHKIVTSFAFGSRRLLELVDRNPLFSFEPMEAVCHPYTVSAQHKMVSVTQVFAIDLSGQACSDQFNGEFYSGIGAQGDFLRGSSRSEGGKPIVCVTSLAEDGETSRIRPQLLVGEGVSVARTDVYYVVTEYGIAYLFGKSVRERAIALIEVAHPKHRQWLLEEAKKLGYLPTDQTLENMRAYPVEEERTVVLKNGKSVMLRPARVSDANGIRELFFKLSPGDVYTRFFRRIRALTREDVQRLCNYNYESEVGFVAVTGPREHETIVGQSCYFVNPSTNLAETAFLIDPGWQGTGLGSAMQNRMKEHAMARSLRGFIAEILPGNEKMIALAKRCSENTHVERDEDAVHVTSLF